MVESIAANTRDLLLVDDESQFRRRAARHFAHHGYRIEETGCGRLALQLASQREFDVALVDTVIPNMSGFEVLRQLKADSNCEVIVLTGQPTIESAIKAIRLGAYDFLSKPARLPQLTNVVEKACHAALQHNEGLRCRVQADDHYLRSGMIGNSVEMQEVYRLIERVGPTDKPVLIQGESGTGKELVAKALHQKSPLADQPLVVINCAALPESLLESELFGHEKGSYTGATVAKLGLFEVADGGTLFIDEIGEMAPSLQAKLLRVLEDGSFRRVGGTEQRRVKVRLLTATNRDLGREVKLGHFREDLFYRIDVMRLDLPPLRHRQGDIPLLARHFAGDGWEIDVAAMRAIRTFDWPGNIRQLINAIDRAKILADGNKILLGNLPREVTQDGVVTIEPRVITNCELSAMTREHIELVLASKDGNKVQTARALGVSRRSLYRLLEKYNIGSN